MIVRHIIFDPINLCYLEVTGMMTLVELPQHLQQIDAAHISLDPQNAPHFITKFHPTANRSDAKH